MATTGKRKARAHPNHYQKKLYKARRILRHPGFDLLVGKAPNSGEGDLMVITPARIGNAVQRNTIRRRVKSLFAELSLLEQGHEWIVIVKKEGVHLTYAQLKQIISSELIPENP